MATTYQEYTGNASTTTFSYPFPVLKTEDIKVALNGVTQTTGYAATISPAQVVFSSAPASGVVVRVYRDTDVDSAKGVYAAGSSIRAVDLNNNQDQVLYALQEEQNQKGIFESISLDDDVKIKFGNGDDATIDWDTDGWFDRLEIRSTRSTYSYVPTGEKHLFLVNNAGVLGVNETYIEAFKDIKPNADGTVDLGASNQEWKDLYIDGTAYLDAVDIDAGAIDGTTIGASSPSTGAFTTLTVNGNTTLGDANTDLIVVNGKINSSLLPNGAFKGLGAAGDTWHYAHIHNLYSYGNTTLCDHSSDTLTVKGAADFDHTLNVDGASTLATVDINGGAIDGTTIGANSAAAGSFTTVTSSTLTTSSNATVSGILTAANFQISGNGLISSDLVTNTSSGTIGYDLGASNRRWDQCHFNDVFNYGDIQIGASNSNTVTLNSKIGSNILPTGTRDIGGSSTRWNKVWTTDLDVTNGQLNTLGGMQSGTASKLADSTTLTSDIADLNQIDGLTKQTTISDSDASFPTSGAVVDYVAAQLAPVGGLEVIATDAVFPNTQPASGVVVSIADAGGLVVNGSGVSTTGRTVGGSTVTINNINSQFNSTTIDNGVAMMVSSTGSGQVYNYHKATLREQDILSISSDIQSFGNRYRVGSSNPSSDNDAGDLFFNTATDKLLVRNAANNSWDEAQSVGNFYIATLSPAFNGVLTEFTITNAPTYASQVLLIINGVLQKPNAGTSAPADGFALDGSTVKLGGAPATGSTYSAVVIGSTVNIGTPSDNTVDADILQSGCVSDAKVAANAAIAGSKINPAFTTAASVTAAQPQLQFQDSDGTNQITQVSNSSGHTYIKTRNNTSGGNFYVNTWDNTNSNYPTLFTILNGGNCGIGTTSPAGKLEINAGSSGTDVIVLRFDSDNGGAFNIKCSDASSATPLWKFDLGISEGLEIDSATTTRFLSGSGDSSIAIGQTGAANDAVVLKYDESGDKLHFYGWGGSEGDILTLDNGNSRVGIGTDSPSWNLDVKGSNTTIGIEGTGWAQLRLTGGGSENYITSDDNLSFYVGGSEKVFINTDGAVGIGTDDPRGSSSYQGLEISGTSGGVVTFSVNETEKWNIYGADAVGGVYDRVNTRYNLKWHSDGDVELPTGNLKVASGKGIMFSPYDTTVSTPGSDSNLLDDYEEGTFNPDLIAYDVNNSNAWENVTFSSVSRYGKYTKIGNLVHINIYFANFHIDSQFDSKLARVGNLPFTVGPSDNWGYSILTYAHGNAMESTGHGFYTNPGQTYATSVVASGTSYNTWSGASGRYLMLSGTYTVA